jgi:hypothetical protein
VAQAAAAPQPLPAAAPQSTANPGPTPATQRINLPAPPPQVPAPTAAAARVLTDAEVTTMLQGTWRLTDGAGVLQVSFTPDGSYRTYREVADPNTFYKVFVQTPVSAGTWTMQNGNMRLQIMSSTDLTRVNQTVFFAVRSITADDFIFVDPVGRVGKAVRLR